MNFALLKHAPLVIFLSAACLVASIEALHTWSGWFPFVERLESMTYDLRVRAALKLQHQRPNDIGVAYIDDESLAEISKRLEVTWPMPRWIHGVILDEIKAQGADAVGYDIFFLRTKPDEFAPGTKPGSKVPSDAVFAQAIRRNGHVFLGVPPLPGKDGSRVMMPAAAFASAAQGVGDARKVPDADGIFRRVRPVIHVSGHGDVWQLGLRMAAEVKGWRLEKAVLSDWSLSIPDASGDLHVIPLDGKGNLLVNWRLAPDDQRLSARSFAQVIGASAHRRKTPDDGATWWKDRLVFVGSFGKAPSLSDRGPTPAGKDTFYCATHWNVAASVLDERFIHPLRLPARLGLILALMTVVAWVSWRLRALWASAAVLLLAAAYAGLCMWSFASHGWWLPVALPLIGSIAVTHGLMVFFRLAIERTQRRKLRSVFDRLVSPKLLDLVIQQPGASWAPREKPMTVIFADIRGFTELTDQPPEESLGLTPIPKKDGPDVVPRQGDQRALEAVNAYLSLVVETIKEHGATLDKYIGDCVMAFWGAPHDQKDHAAAAVRAAIDVQRRIHALNLRREESNAKIESENAARVAAGVAPLPLLPVLTLGTGINTGTMTVGFMGSDAYPSNYTVFGREVNIAARLESLSGSGRIFVTAATRDAATGTDPDLAKLVRSLGGFEMKGIAAPVETFEIDWRV